MTGRIRCRRIGGGRTEPRRWAAGTAMAAALAATVAVLAMGGAGLLAPIGAAFAQTAGTAGPVTIDDLFTGDGVGLNPGPAQRLADAARRAQAPGECPVGRLTINVPKGDEMFQKALGFARRDAVLAFLDRQGIKASRFLADVAIGGTQSNVRLDYNVARDDIAPTLDVTWTPPKGTKVKAGDRITAKAVARDDANRWQTGINTIDLNVDGGGSFGFEDFPRPPQNCENPPPPRTLEGVYRVPANPPPIVRLRAVAKDFAGNETELWAEFPTGDWHGAIKKQVKGGGHNHTINIDYAFEIERSGTIKGRSRAKIATEGGEVPGCTILWTYSPSEFDIPLSGRRDGEDFEIEIEPGTTTATIRSVAGGCATGGGQTSNTFPAHLNPALYAQTKYRITARDGATNTIDRTSGALPWGTVMRDTITIHQARQ